MIAPTEKRMGKSNENIYGMTYCVDGISKTIKTLYFPEKFIGKLTEHKFFILVNSSLGENVNLYDNSKILDGKPFPYDHQMVKDFTTAKTVSVDEAMASPTKKVSVSGIVKGCSPIYTTENSVRKVLYLKSNEETSSTMVIKLWGEKANLTVPPNDSYVKVSDIMMKYYNGNLEGNSTPGTNIEIDADEDELEGEVEGASFEKGDQMILVRNTMYTLSEEDLQKLFPENKFTPMMVKLTVKGQKVMKVIQKNKRAKAENKC